jgi:hypothetical protein
MQTKDSGQLISKENLDMEPVSIAESLQTATTNPPIDNRAVLRRTEMVTVAQRKVGLMVITRRDGDLCGREEC